MKSNELMQLESIRHALALQGFTNWVVWRIIGLLDRTDARLVAELHAALDRLDPDSFTVERLESMLSSVRAANREAYSDVQRELSEVLRAFVVYESSYQGMLLTVALPRVHVAALSAEQVYAAAMARPFQGALLRQFLEHQDADRARKIRQAIAQGFIEGKTNDQLIRELRGTRVENFRDGLLEISRRDAEAVVRTAMGHMAGFVQDRMAEANDDLIKAVEWQATLDTRTSPICRPRDGKQYTPVTHKPIGHSMPWLGGPGRAHWRCRSSQTFVLKTNAELGIDLPEAYARTTRASMDGQVSHETKFNDWLAAQTYERQRAVLGEARANLLRDGKLNMGKLYDTRGRMLTLEQLQRQDALFLKH